MDSFLFVNKKGSPQRKSDVTSGDTPTPEFDESVGYREGTAAYETMMNLWGETAGTEQSRGSKGSKRMLSPAALENVPGAKRPQVEDVS